MTSNFLLRNSINKTEVLIIDPKTSSCNYLEHCLTSQVKSSHLYLYSAFNNTDCVKALNSIKLEDRVLVMYNNKIKHSIFS